MRAEIVLSVVLLAASSPETPGSAPAGRRAGLVPLQAALEAAVSRAARPAAAGVLGGRGASQVYPLPGYGAMIVLSPRALPATARHVLVRGTEGPVVDVPDTSATAKALEDAARSLEESLKGTTSGASRRALERSLEQLRAQQKRLAESQARVLVRRKTQLVTADEIEDLEKEMQARMAEQAEKLRQLELEAHEVHENAALRAQMFAVQAQAEAMRQAAERTRRLAEREVWTHLAPEPPTPRAPAEPSVPAVPPALPVPEVPEMPPAPAPPALVVPEVPEAPPAPAPPALAGEDAVPPAPWQFWFQERRTSRDARTPEKVVADVKEALLTGLAEPGATLSGLGPEDSIVVAVDFRSELLSPRPRTQKTLLARVRVTDVLARRAGTLSADAFRKKVEFEEED